MGTNYFAIPKANDEIRAKIIEAVKVDKWGEARALMPDSVHIGKSSGGWQFLFNHNDWRYFTESEASVATFLNNCEIFDEYNRGISPNEFWVMVEHKRSGKAETQYGFIRDGLVFSNSTEFS